MKKVKVTIELEMTEKYYEDDYADFVYYLKDTKANGKKDFTNATNELDHIVDDNGCDVIGFELDEVE